MFDQLEQAVEDLHVPDDVDGDALAALLAVTDRLAAKVSAAVGGFDARQAWDGEGASSMVAWLRSAGRTRREAAGAVRSARWLRSLPELRSAWEEGVLSSGQVSAVLANLSGRTLPSFAEHEADVVPALAELSVAETAMVAQVWAAHAEAVAGEGDEDREPRRSLHLSETLDGRRELRGHLDAEAGAVVATALLLAASPDQDGEPSRSAPERRADALVDLSRFFLDHQRTRRGGRHRPHVNVVVELDDLAQGRGGSVLGGPALGGDAVERLLCDAGVHRVVLDGASSVLDYGRTTRTVPVNLWNALVVRDETCRFPGCDRPPVWCEGHHVRHWTAGGPTCLDNLVVLCSRHHHRLHSPGWSAKLLPGGTVEVTDPAGTVRTSEAPRRRRRRAEEALERRAVRAGPAP